MSITMRDEHDSTLFQNTEVNGQNCLDSIIRNSSPKSKKAKISSPFNKIKTSNSSKGIKLTQSKSLNNITNRTIKTSIKLKPNNATKDSDLLIKKIKTSETADYSQQIQQTTFKINKKCLDYKNRMILEHSVKPEQIMTSQHLGSELFLTSRKTQGNMSTQLNTPRQSKQISFNQIQEVHQSIIVNVIEERTLQNQEVSQSDEKKSQEIKKNTKQNPSIRIKTIENLYELKAGKKMQVFKSEISEQADQDAYSIVQSFIWT